MMAVGIGARRKDTLSVVVSALYSTHHLQKMIAVSLQLAPEELMLVIASHLIDELPKAVRQKTRIILIDDPSTPFAGRKLAAEKARGELLLFLGEDQWYSPAALQRFLFPMRYGNAEIVLPQARTLTRDKKNDKPINSFSYLLNDLYGRADLQEASLLSTPHGITKRAVQRLGTALLEHPAQAHRKLIQSGLQIVTQVLEPLPGSPPFNPQLYGALRSELSTYEKAVIKEQLDVIAALSERGGLTDGGRKREGLVTTRPQQPVAFGQEQSLSVIIPARNEAGTIEAVIREVGLLDPAEVIVVVNGSTDQTACIARKCGATTVVFSEALGVDSGRAAGASLATGGILLFVDADFVIPAQELYPFVLGCRRGMDLALNDQSAFLESQHARNVVVAARGALNLALNRKDLEVGSMLAVPFALRREAFARLGWSLLACPPKAQAAAIMAGLNVQQAHQVDSFASNRFRPEKHVARKGRSSAADQIIGDHIEAFHYLIQNTCKEVNACHSE